MLRPKRVPCPDRAQKGLTRSKAPCCAFSSMRPGYAAILCVSRLGPGGIFAKSQYLRRSEASG
jgi:hypothetical protein